MPLATAPAASQSAWSAGATVGFVEHRVNAGYGNERFTGLALGLDVERHIGSRLAVRLRGQGGELQPDAAGDLDRRVGEAEFSARLTVAPVFGVYVGGTMRAISSDAGRQRWTFARIGGEFRPAFTGERFHAVGRIGLIPFVAVRGLSTASMTVDGAVGLDYERDRLTLGLRYTLERFAFTAGGDVARSEQMSALTFRAGIRMSRRSSP